ncbi:MAG: hypothetical protein M5U34_26425 [Chloroflexi bacterium]|nr:hypothetical protein [Chloroflexota bacterium]
MKNREKSFNSFPDTDPVTITIYPPRGKPGNPFGNPTNTLLTQAGFLTSAYLLAFFEYGYRYIMQTSLDPVREYILQSFEKKVDERLNFDNSKNLCFQICSDPSHYCVDPEIYLVIPADENVPFYQETRFLDFHVRLPVPSFFPGVSRHDLITEFVALGEQSLGEYEKDFL